MSPLEEVLNLVENAHNYFLGIKCATDSNDDGKKAVSIFTLSPIEDIADDIKALMSNGRYVEDLARDVPTYDRHYVPTRTDMESLLKAADVSLAEKTGLTEETTRHITLMNENATILECKRVADALGITLDELFWRLYKLS